MPRGSLTLSTRIDLIIVILKPLARYGASAWAVNGSRPSKAGGVHELENLVVRKVFKSAMMPRVNPLGVTDNQTSLPESLLIIRGVLGDL